jgi:mRNA-degrading endonuclease YafQ of YafQ-DinJ toxin-antitoxin module
VEFEYTKTFRRSYGKLASDQQGKIDDAIRDFSDQPHFPFPLQLKVHKLSGRKGTATSQYEMAPDVWEMHATGLLLITFQYGSNSVLFRQCGIHDNVLRNP